ncbi:MAG TPA: chorismate synthase [Lachnospiraceae bacterium]|nr:chorismate synthase [Lachnospiraceae bacterium]
MAGSVFGQIFKMATWGESHGKGIGVVVDGCPAGLALDEAKIQAYLDRRKPGQTKYSTPRKEDDAVEILSGVFEGFTTGTPISMAVYNKSQRPKDYSAIACCYRPGHADYTFDMKYGFRDYRGGGRSSGRETIGRVAAGAVAAEVLKEFGIEVCAYTKSIGGITIDDSYAGDCLYGSVQDLRANMMKSPLYMPDPVASQKAEELLLHKMQEKDSAGGIIECIVSGMPAGVGEPVFEKLDANIAKAVMSVGAVKGVEIGTGNMAAQSYGSCNNDSFYSADNTAILKRTNNAGGILGGISDGSNIVVRAAVKPTPSIAKMQHTVDKNGTDTDIEIKGRHDPVIVPRAVVVVEAMTATVVLDMLMMSMLSRMDLMKKFFTL